MSDKWIGWDLDGTLAVSEPGVDDLLRIGPPIVANVRRLRRHLEEGYEVRIVTARVSVKDGAEMWAQMMLIRAWLKEHVTDRALVITAIKGVGMIELWDDRAVAVERNTGRRLSPSKTEPDHPGHHPDHVCQFYGGHCACGAMG